MSECAPPPPPKGPKGHRRPRKGEGKGPLEPADIVTIEMMSALGGGEEDLQKAKKRSKNQLICVRDKGYKGLKKI